MLASCDGGGSSGGSGDGEKGVRASGCSTTVCERVGA